MGGLELQLLQLLRRPDLERYRFSFLVTHRRVGTLAAEIESCGGEILRIDPSWIPPVMASRVGRIIERLRPDVVEAHDYFHDGLVLRAAARAGVPCRIGHLHNLARHRGGGRWRKRFYCRMTRRWLERHATAIVAVSDQVMASTLGADWRSDPRAVVIHNGVHITGHAAPVDRTEVRSEWGIPPDAKLVIHVGRFRKVKNHDVMLEAADALHRAGRDDVHWLFVGDGSRREECEQRVRGSGLAERVHFAGFRSDVSRLLRSADVFVLPSEHEGLCNAVLEALACDLPVVTSDLPALHEIDDICGGIRFLPDISARALADALQDVLAGRTPHPIDREALEQGFGFDAMFDKLMPLYGSCRDGTAPLQQGGRVLDMPPPADCIERRP